VKIAILGGLVDGINPCAFAVIVFLISFLSVKKEVLVPAVMFILGVFICYFLLGIGGYYFLKKIIIPTIASVLTRIIAILIICLGIVHFFDKTEKPAFSLPETRRKKIRSLIIRTGLINGNPSSFFLLGIIIALMEATCTGQVYLPVIYSFVALGIEKAYLYLLVYNLFFIMPLCFVAYLGIKAKEVLKTFDVKYLKKFKIALGIFLVGLGIYLLKRGCNCEKESFIWVFNIFKC